MEEDKGRVEKSEGEDDWNIVKISTFHKVSPFPPSPSFPNISLFLP